MVGCRAGYVQLENQWILILLCELTGQRLSLSGQKLMSTTSCQSLHELGQRVIFRWYDVLDLTWLGDTWNVFVTNLALKWTAIVFNRYNHTYAIVSLKPVSIEVCLVTKRTCKFSFVRMLRRNMTRKLGFILLITVRICLKVLKRSGVGPNDLPYILAYKSQNLRQNLDVKVRGATYTRVIK